MRERNKNQWLLLSCGCCAGIVILIASVIGGSIFFGATMFKGMISDLADPVAREKAALELLGAEELPTGFHTLIYFKIPFFIQIVALSDGEAAQETPGETFEEQIESLEHFALTQEKLGANLFLFLRLRSDDDSPIEDMISGSGDSSGTNLDLDIDVESLEQLTRGELELTSGSVSYVSYRGNLEVSGEVSEGTYATLRFACGDSISRQALWFQRSEPVDSEMGNPADESAIRSMVAHFQLCK